MAKPYSPSVDAFTATKRSKFSSTNILMASDLESIEDWRLEIPAAKSWYVAFGWTVARNALGSKDFEVIKTEASAIKSR